MTLRERLLKAIEFDEAKGNAAASDSIESAYGTKEIDRPHLEDAHAVAFMSAESYAEKLRPLLEALVECEAGMKRVLDGLEEGISTVPKSYCHEQLTKAQNKLTAVLDEMEKK